MTIFQPKEPDNGPATRIATAVQCLRSLAMTEQRPIPDYAPAPPRPARRSGGSIPLFRLFGIDVSLHWLWFVVAFYEIQLRRSQYSSIVWNALEYISIFVIVLLHE